MTTDQLRSLLSRIRSIRDRCDLDLLLFFYRHPRALLTSEQLGAYVGYDTTQIAKSLDALIEARLLTRSQNPIHAARLYVLVLPDQQGGVLASLLQIASTRVGRQELRRLLESRPSSTRRVDCRDGRSVANIA